MENLKGLVTGIGILPYTDADEALDLIFKYCPAIPFWPQLPKRDLREGMLAQFSENLPCLKFTDDGLLFDPKNRDTELEKFYDRLLAEDLEHFKITTDYASGLYRFYQRLNKQDLTPVQFIKVHVTGPFTFSASIQDEKTIALLHDSIFMQAILKGLVMKALWQIKLFRRFGKRIIVFIDEPYLGCFGSAYTPVNKEEVVRGLREFSAGIKSENVLTGLHCCGNTDWSIFTALKSIDIISFDAFSFLDKFVLYAQDLKDFLERGGIICWGIVPTQEFTAKVTAQLLTAKIAAGIDTLVTKGLPKDLLLKNLLLSPACGLGTLDTKKAESIFNLLQQTSSIIKNSR